MNALALLVCATLFGGMILYSFGFAAFVFKALPADQAGGVLRQAFPWYYLFVIGAAGLAAAVTLVVAPVQAALLAACAALGIYARQVLMVQINAARDAQLAGQPGAARRFGLLHGWSVVINFLQLGAVGYVIVSFL